MPNLNLVVVVEDSMDWNDDVDESDDETYLFYLSMRNYYWLLLEMRTLLLMFGDFLSYAEDGICNRDVLSYGLHVNAWLRR